MADQDMSQPTDETQSRPTAQVSDDQPETVGEAITEAADEDPSLSMEWEKKIKDKLTGDGS